MGFYGSRCTCSAGSDDENIHIVIYFVKIHIHTQNPAVGFQKKSELRRHFFSFVGPHLECKETVFPVIRMIRGKKGIFFFCSHSFWLSSHPPGSGSFYLFDGVLHIG